MAGLDGERIAVKSFAFLTDLSNCPYMQYTHSLVTHITNAHAWLLEIAISYSDMVTTSRCMASCAARSVAAISPFFLAIPPYVRY